MDDHGWSVKCAQDLSHEVCGVIIKLWNKDARAVSVHERHASVEVQVQCVNVVIGVVLGELHVVRVVPVVVCDDAVVRRTLVLIAFTVAIVFIVAILRRILLYWRYSVYKSKGTSVLITLGTNEELDCPPTTVREMVTS